MVLQNIRERVVESAFLKILLTLVILVILVFLIILIDVSLNGGLGVIGDAA